MFSTTNRLQFWMPLPLLLRAQQRLVMRGAHDDAVLVGELGRQRIVLVEGVVPHRRPQIVRLQSKCRLQNTMSDSLGYLCLCKLAFERNHLAWNIRHKAIFQRTFQKELFAPDNADTKRRRKM